MKLKIYLYKDIIDLILSFIPLEYKLNKFYNLQDYAHFLKESYKVHNKDYFHT